MMSLEFCGTSDDVFLVSSKCTSLFSTVFCTSSVCEVLSTTVVCSDFTSIITE